MERTIKPRPPIHPNIECAGVLVVEDNAIQRANMVCQLRELGVHKIYEAENGLVGLNIVRNLYQPPAIIVLDLHMPGMDGIELAQHLVPEGVRPYLLLASAVEMSILGSVEVMLEALDLPLLGILRKPFHLEHLQAAIVRYSSMNLAHRERLREPTGVATTATSLQCALDKGYIQPFYQPKVKLASGLVTGLEALARWVEPDGLERAGGQPAAGVRLRGAEPAARVGEHHGVAAVRGAAAPVGDLLDQDAVAGDEGVVHGRRRDVERLDEERLDDDGEHQGDAEQQDHLLPDRQRLAAPARGASGRVAVRRAAHAANLSDLSVGATVERVSCSAPRASP